MSAWLRVVVQTKKQAVLKLPAKDNLKNYCALIFSTIDIF